MEGVEEEAEVPLELVVPEEVVPEEWVQHLEMVR